MEKNEVRRVFSNFGIVTDVFLPSKQSVRGTRFGFVRYNCEVAAWMAVEKGNRVWIKDKQVKVNMAASGRVKRSSKPGVLRKDDRTKGPRDEPEGLNIPLIQGDTSGDEWLRRSFIVERALCRKERLNIDGLLADFEFKIKMARLERTKWILVPDSEEDFQHAK
ncbi:hypothetical protein Dimus_003002 [Dionaea muscipula]